MKVDLDGRKKLSEKDKESVSAALDSTAAVEGELMEVKAELRAGREKLKPAEEDLGGKLAVTLGDIEKWEARFQNSSFLEETFRKHPYFNGFAKGFSDAGFEFLMNGVAAVAPEVDLVTFKQHYTAKWAVGPHDTSCLQGLVDCFMKELDSEYEDDSEEDDAAKVLQDK